MCNAYVVARQSISLTNLVFILRALGWHFDYENKTCHQILCANNVYDCFGLRAQFDQEVHRLK